MRRAGWIAAVLLLLGAAFATGLLVTRSLAPAPTPVVAPAPRLVEEVRRELASRYYRPVPRKALRQDTIEAVLTALDDPYTEHLDAAEYAELKNKTAQSYSGVGLSLERSRQGLRVRAVLRGPAREAGMARGDVIVAVDGRVVRKLRFDEALTLLTGETGTAVTLTVRRARAEREVVVVRDQIETPTTRSRILTARDVDVGYLRLLSFSADGSERVAAATERLLERGATALVLDLRDNPGGLLSEAVRVASLFQEEGVVCTTRGRSVAQKVLQVSGDAPFGDLPLVVLVNRETASAAEIVAGAVRGNGRGPLVGERTYGKGLVQTIRELSNGEALKLTTAVLVTPTGRSLERGLRPDLYAVDHPSTRRDEALAAARRVLVDQLASA